MTQVSSRTAALRRSPRLFKFIRVHLSRKLWGTYRIQLRNIVSGTLGWMLIGIGLPAGAVPVAGQAAVGSAQIAGSILNKITTPGTNQINAGVGAFNFQSSVNRLTSSVSLPSMGAVMAVKPITNLTPVPATLGANTGAIAIANRPEAAPVTVPQLGNGGFMPGAPVTQGAPSTTSAPATVVGGSDIHPALSKITPTGANPVNSQSPINFLTGAVNLPGMGMGAVTAVKPITNLTPAPATLGANTGAIAIANRPEAAPVTVPQLGNGGFMPGMPGAPVTQGAPSTTSAPATVVGGSDIHPALSKITPTGVNPINAGVGSINSQSPINFLPGMGAVMAPITSLAPAPAMLGANTGAMAMANRPMAAPVTVPQFGSGAFMPGMPGMPVTQGAPLTTGAPATVVGGSDIHPALSNITPNGANPINAGMGLIKSQLPMNFLTGVVNLPGMGAVMAPITSLAPAPATLGVNTGAMAMANRPMAAPVTVPQFGSGAFMPGMPVTQGAPSTTSAPATVVGGSDIHPALSNITPNGANPINAGMGLIKSQSPMNFLPGMGAVMAPITSLAPAPATLGANTGAMAMANRPMAAPMTVSQFGSGAFMPGMSGMPGMPVTQGAPSTTSAPATVAGGSDIHPALSNITPNGSNPINAGMGLIKSQLPMNFLTGVVNLPGMGAVMAPITNLAPGPATLGANTGAMAIGNRPMTAPVTVPQLGSGAFMPVTQGAAMPTSGTLALIGGKDLTVPNNLTTSGGATPLAAGFASLPVMARSPSTVPVVGMH